MILVKVYAGDYSCFLYQSPVCGIPLFTNVDIKKVTVINLFICQWLILVMVTIYNVIKYLTEYYISGNAKTKVSTITLI